MLGAIHEEFIPHKIVLLVDGGSGQRVFGGSLEFVRDMVSTGGAATAYVCQDHVCQSPTTNLAVLARLLAPKQAHAPSGGRNR
jgi:uncharacterized protein YyaL (SSP411 family)